MEECKNKYLRFLTHIKGMVRSEHLEFYNKLNSLSCEQFLAIMRENYKDMDYDKAKNKIIEDFFIHTSLNENIINEYHKNDVDLIYRYVEYFYKIITLI